MVMLRTTPLYQFNEVAFTFKGTIALMNRKQKNNKNSTPQKIKKL